MERWPSGLRRLLGKQVYGNPVPRVRIPPSPPKSNGPVGPILFWKRASDENPCSTNRQDCRFGPRSGPVGVPHRDVRYQSRPLRQNQKRDPRGSFIDYQQRVWDENPVRQNALAFWTHAVRPAGVRIAQRRFESIPPSPPHPKVLCRRHR